MMPVVFAVSLNVLREAASRRWLLALFLVVTAALVVLALSLEMDVVDGALAGTQLFGKLMSQEIGAVDVALRPVFHGVAFLLFYGGLIFGTLAYADFAPSLLSPGRIEHLLALPIKRWELLVGTYLGVMSIAVFFTVYSAGGFILLMGIKTGVYVFSLFYAGALACVVFAAIYGAMLAASVFVQSAAVSAIVGLSVFFSGLIASNRESIGEAFASKIGKAVFDAVTYAIPPIVQIAQDGAELASSRSVDMAAIYGRIFGVVAFGFACVAVGIWHFEQKDF